MNARHFLVGGAKCCGCANFVSGGKMGFGDGDGAACKQCHAESRLSSMGKWYCGTQGQILRCAFFRAMACVSKAPHGNRHWEDPFAATGCFFVRTVLTGQSSEPTARKLCSAACAVVCSRSLSCDTAGSSASMGLCMQVQAPKTSIFHIRVLGLSRSQKAPTS